MIWKIEFDEKALREFKKLDKAAQRLIRNYLRKRIAPQPDPAVFGKELRHDLAGIWRYRVGDYRILCRFEKQELIVLVIAVGHRKDIYQ